MLLRNDSRIASQSGIKAPYDALLDDPVRSRGGLCCEEEDP